MALDDETVGRVKQPEGCRDRLDPAVIPNNRHIADNASEFAARRAHPSRGVRTALQRAALSRETCALRRRRGSRSGLRRPRSGRRTSAPPAARPTPAYSRPCGSRRDDDRWSSDGAFRQPSRRPLLSAQWRITHSCASRYVRRSKEISTAPRSQASWSARLPVDRGRPRRRRSSGNGLPELGGTDRLRGASPRRSAKLGACWRCRSRAADERLASARGGVPTLRPGLSRSGRPGRRPATGIAPRSGVRELSCVWRPVASAMPLSAADGQHLGERRCPRPSTRCSRTLL